VWTERLLLRQVKAMYQQRLRKLVAELPPEITAEILAGMTGVTREFTQNWQPALRVYNPVCFCNR
jgi:hypothetical protein